MLGVSAGVCTELRIRVLPQVCDNATSPQLAVHRRLADVFRGVPPVRSSVCLLYVPCRREAGGASSGGPGFADIAGVLCSRPCKLWATDDKPFEEYEDLAALSTRILDRDM